MTKPTPGDPARLSEEQQISALHFALVEGEESGPATPFDFEAFIACKRGEHAPWTSNARPKTG